MMPSEPNNTLTNYMVEPLAQCLAEWRHWGAELTEAPSLIKTLDGGTTNSSYMISIKKADEPKKTSWVLRIHKQNLLFKTDRGHEKTIQKIANQLKLAQVILYQHPHGDYQVCEYIDGVNITQQLPLTKDLTQQLCNCIKQLHQTKFDLSKSKISTYLYSDHINRYWRFLLQKNSFHNNAVCGTTDDEKQHYQSMLRQCLTYEKHYGQERVLCHHDLNSENILHTPNTPLKFSILDWEFAGAGIASMDFACLATELSIDINQMSDFSGIDTEQLNCAQQIYQYTCEVYNRALAYTV